MAESGLKRGLTPNDTHDPRIGNKFLNIFGESAGAVHTFLDLHAVAPLYFPNTKPRAHAIPFVM